MVKANFSPFQMHLIYCTQGTVVTVIVMPWHILFDFYVVQLLFDLVWFGSLEFFSSNLTNGKLGSVWHLQHFHVTIHGTGAQCWKVTPLHFYEWTQQWTFVEMYAHMDMALWPSLAFWEDLSRRICPWQLFIITLLKMAIIIIRTFQSLFQSLYIKLPHQQATSIPFVHPLSLSAPSFSFSPALPMLLVMYLLTLAPLYHPVLSATPSSSLYPPQSEVW